MPAQAKDNVFIIGDIEDDIPEQLFLPLTEAVETQSNLKDGKIVMYVNSHGGYSHFAFHVVELMEIAKRNGVIVQTVVMDQACSAGSVISVAGTPGERYASPGARFLIHYGYAGTWASTPKNAERYNKEVYDHFGRVHDHYHYYCDIPDLEEHMADDNWFLDFKAAKKYKLFDKHIDKFEI